MKISVIVVNYRTPQLVYDLIRQTEKIPIVSEIIIVDNSGDIAEASIAGRRNVTLLTNKENIGFGAAVNKGIRDAAADWVLILNPDTRVSGECLEYLLNAATRYHAPLVSPRFYWDDARQFRLPPATGTSWGHFMGHRYAEVFPLDAALYSFYWAIRHDRYWQATEPFFEPFLSGACLLVSADWIQAGGGKLFDERFFLYYEDTDLCAKALLQGVSPICVPQAEAVHYYNQSPASNQEKEDLITTSESQFFQKYYGRLPAGLTDESAVSHSYVDMGELLDPPSFVFEKAAVERSVKTDCFFEIGINPIFVPFAQAVIGTNAGRFAFPEAIWQNLSSGTYYARLRNPQTHSLKVWKWIKQ